MKTYLVGGAVRDRLLGRSVRERDWVVVGASEADMLARGFRRVGHAFPVFIDPRSGEEYALARTESKISPGHQGFEIYASKEVSLETDLRRRDLTINAMAEADGEIIDPYGGRSDLDKRLLRHVSDAFVEDPLRVLRVARFSAELRDFGFEVAEETLDIMREIGRSGELETLSRERVRNELARVLNTRWLDTFLRVLERTDCLHPWFTECQWRDAEYTQIGHWQRCLPSSLGRLAALGGLLDEDACTQLLARLAPPNRHRRATLLVARHHDAIRCWQPAHLQDVLAALLALSRLKPAETRMEVLRTLAVVAEVDPEQLATQVASFDALRPASDSTGADYGRALKVARTELVARWLQEAAQK